MVMHPYWVTFERQATPVFLVLGAGVTARSEEDARELVQAEFPEAAIATVRRVLDVAELEQGHVAPNIGNMLLRGIWYPWTTRPESPF